MLKNLLARNWSRRRSALPRLVMAVTLLLMLAITASAYTLVFRNGQRMEIPSEFTLTRTTLTYEVSPGFNKTMLVILIDVAATERANNEAPGSFFKHREEAPVITQPTPTPRASRTLTNSDLAAVRQRRIESERAYETRRKELGLPTVEESRRIQEEDGAIFREQLREKSAAMAREESYWRERSRDLRLEIATVDTQINYLRGRLGEFNESSLITGSVITGTYPLWPNNRGQWPFPNQRQRGYRVARPVYGLGFPYPQYPYQYPNQYPMGPFDNFENSTQQSDLTNRLDDLLVRRAGLAARWRALEDEARDARVPQIWLEPK